MSRINEKLGIKPAGKRRRTHPDAPNTPAHVLTALRCVRCSSGYIVEFVAFHKVGRLCGQCGQVQP